MRATIFFIIIFFTSLIFCCKRISVGSVGLKVDQTGDERGVNPMENVSGWVFYNPIASDVIEFPTSMQHVEYETFHINAFGGSQFEIKPYVNYVVDPAKADLIYKEFKTTDLEDISVKYIRNSVYQSFTDITGKYSSDELLKNREKYERDVFENLKAAIAKKGFILQQVTSNLNPPKSLIDAINKKNTADQEAQRINLQVAQVEAQAKKDIAKAKGDSASQVIRASARAKALLISADSETEYNRKLSSTITDNIIRNRFFDTWDGKLPTYGTVPTLFKDIK